jgi:hypothetical protein
MGLPSIEQSLDQRVRVEIRRSEGLDPVESGPQYDAFAQANLRYHRQMRGGFVFALCMLCACGATLASPVAGGDDVPGDAAVTDDTPDVDAPLGAWGAPVMVGSAGDAVANEDDGSLSYSGLEMVFAVVNTADGNRKDLFYTARPDLASPFGTAVKLPFSIDNSAEETPRFGRRLTLRFAKTNAPTVSTSSRSRDRRPAARTGAHRWPSRASAARARTSGSCRAPAIGFS